MTTSLTPDQRRFFAENAYLTGLPPVYTPDEMAADNAELTHLAALLEPGESFKDIREWHETSRWLFDIVVNPRIHPRLGRGYSWARFLLLGASNFFVKEPGTRETVGWHQDAYYWPMSPHHSVTVWLAFTDVDEDNGAMRIVPGSHLGGHHRTSTARTGRDRFMTLELQTGTFAAASAVPLCLRVGEVSLHDDRAVHSSQANRSACRRAGLAIFAARPSGAARYSISGVYCT